MNGAKCEEPEQEEHQTPAEPDELSGTSPMRHQDERRAHGERQGQLCDDPRVRPGKY